MSSKVLKIIGVFVALLVILGLFIAIVESYTKNSETNSTTSNIEAPTTTLTDNITSTDNTTGTASTTDNVTVAIPVPIQEKAWSTTDNITAPITDYATARQILDTHDNDIFKIKNVNFTSVYFKDGRWWLKIGVSQWTPEAEKLVGTSIQGIPVVVEEIGEIKAFDADRTIKWRPAPPGVSIGHVDVTAGTFGCTGYEADTKYILSNNHVLADCNDGEIGDSILQPGAYDGGVDPTDRIGTLAEFVPLIWDDINNPNLVDCALALPDDENDLSDELLELQYPSGSEIAEVGMEVAKSGRTTGVTMQTIKEFSGLVDVDYGEGRHAYFDDQIVTAQLMAQGGDSGSCLIDLLDNKAVGLLFAGSQTYAFFNRMTEVEDALDFTVYDWQPEHAIGTTQFATTNGETGEVTLNGNVPYIYSDNPHRYFEWGTESGVYTHTEDMGIGGLGQFSKTLTLDFDTYYYRVKVVDGVYTDYGVEIQVIHYIPSIGMSNTVATRMTTQASYQRKAFDASGRHWVFYTDGVDGVYSTSLDGEIWSSPTLFRSDIADGFTFAIWFDGVYLHYVYYPYWSVPNGTHLVYRRGLPNADGTITWSTDEQLVEGVSPTVMHYKPTICVDSNGYVWIGYQDGINENAIPMVTRSGNNDGTWGTTPEGFPFSLAGASSGWQVAVFPLTAGKILAAYSYYPASGDYQPLFIRAWTGSAWKDTVQTTSEVFLDMNTYPFSVVAIGDDAHIVFTSETSNNVFSIRYVKYTYATNTLSAEEKVNTAFTNSVSAILSKDSSNILYCFWADIPNTVYGKKYENGLWGDLFALVVSPIEFPWSGVEYRYQAVMSSSQDDGAGTIMVYYLLGRNPPYYLYSLPVSTGEWIIPNQLTVYSTSADGYIGNSNADYATAREVGTGNLVNIVTPNFGGDNSLSGSTYYIKRIFLYFDASELPDNCVLTSATMSLQGYSSHEYDGYVQLGLYKGTQHDTLEVADYDAFETTPLSDDCSPWNYGMPTDEYSTIALNAAGIAAISKTGISKFCIRIGGDVGSNEPSGSNYNYVNSSERGVGYQPKLIVEYTEVTVPIVTTITPATSIETTTATCAGIITITGGENCTKKGICYSTSAYPTISDNKTEEIGSYGDSTAISENITSLSTGTTYHFRAYGYNTAGYSYGEDRTLLTKPAAPTNVSATENDATGVTVTWAASYGATAYHIFRDASDLGAQSSGYKDIGGTAGVVYAYTVVASNATGNSVASSPDNGCKLAGASTITLLAATNIENTTATLNGNITDDGGNTDNVTVMVYWGDNDGEQTVGNWDYNSAPTSPGSQPQGEVAFYKDATGLPTGTTIYFSASATNSAGTSWPTASLNFLTKPAAPTNVAASDGTYTDNVTVTWTKSIGATGYKVYEGINLLYTLGDVDTYDDTTAPAGAITEGTADACNGCDTGFITLSISGESASHGSLRTYKVVAFNATGNSNDSLTDTGYRGVGALTYEWFRSDADSDADYNTSIGIANPYNDINAPAPIITEGTAIASDNTYSSHTELEVTGQSANVGDGRWYYCALSAIGATSKDTNTDRGYTGTTILAYQWKVSAADSDADYSDIGDGTTNPYSYTSAPAPTITAGTAIASDGTSNAYVTLSIAGESANIGIGRWYLCIISMPGASNVDTIHDRGYRGVGTLAYQWQRSAADSDANYSDLDDAITNPYNDTTALADGSGRYYYCTLSATGATNADTNHDRGYRSAVTTTTQAATNVGATTVTGNGSIENLGGSDNCTRHGFSWDICSHTLWSDYANDVHTDGSFSTGTFSDYLTDLPTGTTIYFRAYATSPLGTGQGDEMIVLTLGLPSPPLTVGQKYPITNILLLTPILILAAAWKAGIAKGDNLFAAVLLIILALSTMVAILQMPV